MSVVAPDPARGMTVRSEVDVCAFIDDLPPDSTGELVLRSGAAKTKGAVFIEDGRICWAAARGLARRLSDLLAASAHLDREAMELLVHACKRDGTPLGQYLVAAGVVTADELRSALLKHTAESLHMMCDAGASAEWNVRRSGQYSPSFTFTTTELLPRALAEGHAPLAASIASELAEAFPGRDWGAAFARGGWRAAPDPIAVQGAWPDKVEVLFRLGRWAASALDVTTPLHDASAFVSAFTGTSAIVAWRSGDAILAGFTHNAGPARLLNLRARARRKDKAHGDL